MDPGRFLSKAELSRERTPPAPIHIRRLFLTLVAALSREGRYDGVSPPGRPGRIKIPGVLQPRLKKGLERPAPRGCARATFRLGRTAARKIRFVLPFGFSSEANLSGLNWTAFAAAIIVLFYGSRECEGGCGERINYSVV